jgi:hypothetical protein
MAEMKKIYFLSVRERHDKPQLVLSIFLWVIFISSPLSGLLNPDNLLNVHEKHYHDNPQGFFTFFALIQGKNFHTDTMQNNMNTPAVKELSMDTTPKNPIIQKTTNVVIW